MNGNSVVIAANIIDYFGSNSGNIFIFSKIASDDYEERFRLQIATRSSGDFLADVDIIMILP